LQEIRTALDALGKKNGRVYGLTAALPCGPANMENIEIDVVSNILSELNLMTYDFYG
jgi:chitinase